VRQHAALVSRKLTRVPSGVNLPPLEVIMSRLQEVPCFLVRYCVGRDPEPRLNGKAYEVSTSTLEVTTMTLMQRRLHTDEAPGTR
jgi:hypothetical protein